MKKTLLTAILFLLCSTSYAAVELDGDANGAVDISKGGTNATTAANARTALGVPATAATLVGDCTVGPCLDGSSDGGNLIKLWAGTGAYWTALQGGAPAANRSWRLPIAAPPSAGETNVMTMDEYGQMSFLDKPSTSGYVLSSTDAGVLSWEAPSSSGLTSLPTADNQILQATGSGTYAWTSTLEGIIDDTKGNGDTTYIWSADKVYDQLALKSPLADPVFTSSLTLPQGASPTVDAAGEVAVDTTSDQLIFYGSAKHVVTGKYQENFVVKSPADSDDFLLFKARQAITVTDIHVIAQGGTSISVDIQECDSAGANCSTVDAAITADTDGAEDDGTLSNPSIDAGDWVKVVLGAPSGTVNFVSGSIYYNITAD